MTKYISLLTGSGDLSDADCRKFLSLFVGDKGARQALLCGRYSQEQRSTIGITLSNIVHICSFYEREEIANESNLVLLTLAMRYKKQGKGFSGYIKNSYYYELGRRIKDMTQDPILFQANSNLSFSDTEYADPNMRVDDVDMLDRIDNMIIEDEEDELGDSWVQGTTCCEAFEKLTSLERLLLKYHYSDKLTDRQVADRIGYHPDTIRRNRKKAVGILRRELDIHEPKEK
jgi:RNA polymerase sigma factor (sigma-70 family)